ncbi:MAG: bifunctional aldolase/short-chain dehydrogenase [Deltaproteobacteria bacterium]|nr:bifunctional aldolase/short-chain dehydrogenase [Deltaproteobacteria bacterium]
MQNRWNDSDAAQAVSRYQKSGVSEDLALRVYSARLIGGDPMLVLHGGGNTSVKGAARDVTGKPVEVVYVKGSGWDMAAIQPAGFPAVRLEPLLAMQQLETLSDEEMVNSLRTNLLDAKAPTPSVEALLHAFLPHRYVDHTHADAVVALVDTMDPPARCREVFGDKLGVLPFCFPGFPLAGRVMELYQKNPSVEGIVLVNHGLFTFGATAKESYDRMIHYVALAQQALDKAGRRVFAGNPSLAGEKWGKDAASRQQKAVKVAPILRGALALPAGDSASQGEGAGKEPHPGGPWKRWQLTYRHSDAIGEFVDGADLADYSQRGVATPDHIIRTKNLPLVVPPPDMNNLADFGQTVREAVTAYQRAYHLYFDENRAKSPAPKTELDPQPRVVLVPGVGLFAAGASARDGAVTADLYQHTVDIIAQAEGVDRYTPLGPEALFEMEYWSLEQAKLGGAKEKPMARQVVLVTGAASGIGAATALAFAQAGAAVVLLDRPGSALDGMADQVRAQGVGALAVEGDVTCEADVERGFDQAVLAFGGVDVVVSNAGRVWQGAMADVIEEDLRASFELNFFAHQRVASRAVGCFQAQGTGGCLLFNASKSAFNPGPGLGPYTLPKAAVVALMKQYAVDYGHLGVRSNAVNADRVNTALFGEGVLESRSRARGVSVSEYLAGNLLHQEVLASDVGQAFVALALAAKTTGAVLTVDGGNIAAAPR